MNKPLSNELSREELRERVHSLFGDQQAYDNGYQSCYGGKWLDMTNEVVAVADFIDTYTAQREQAAVEAVTPFMIMGKTIDEICVILSALELERIADMQMTMNRLDDWMKLVREDHRKAVQKALDRTIENALQATNTKEGE